MNEETKRLLGASLLFLVTVVAAGNVRGQGAIYLNDYDPGTGVFLQMGGTLAPAPQGTVVQVLTGSNPDSLAPVLNASPNPTSVFTVGPGDVAANTDGGSAFDGGYGYSYIPAFSQGWIELVCSVTVGGTSYSGSLEWLQAVGGPQPPDASLPTLAQLAEPSALIMYPVPEPSTLNLGVLSAAMLLRLRHRWCISRGCRPVSGSLGSSK